MTDPTQAPEPPDTPAPADTTDWQQRYESLQPEYTRTTQQLRRFESDPEALLEFIQAHHPDMLDADEPDPEPDPNLDPDLEDPLSREVQELRAWREQVEQAQQQQVIQQEWSGWEQHVKNLAQQDGVELSRRDINALRVDSHDQNGMPVGPDKAKQLLDGYLSELTAERERIIEEARKRPRAPRAPGDGSPATKVPDLDDPQQRVAWMAQEWADRSA